jgi:hypothetical protein
VTKQLDSLRLEIEADGGVEPSGTTSASPPLAGHAEDTSAAIESLVVISDLPWALAACSQRFQSWS